MILFPAIDLKGGQCVRLIKGDMAQATVFNTDPADQARQFAAAGAEWLHLVDLDGAFAGEPVNEAAVEGILKATALPVQLGGGIRDMARIEAWLEKGVARVILGTVALKNPDLVKEACRRFPGKIAVGIDAKGGKVAVEGWAETSELTAFELARRFEDAGVAAIIYTDIDRDGLLQGVNVEATAALAASLSIPVIASGGVSSLADIDALLAALPASRAKGGGIVGVISGRAIYDGRLDLKSALQRLRERSSC
jgi:phosphoribosylformimino-5-aminoimidazole carboxamide ribotide isomerase